MTYRPQPFNARQEMQTALARALARLAPIPNVRPPPVLATSASDLVFKRVALNDNVRARKDAISRALG